MGLTVKSSFSAGELDPVLQERTTLDKYKSGLATARNSVVSKTGSILSRPGRFNFAQGKFDNSFYVNYSPPGSGLLLEWGHLYIRVYVLAGGALIGDFPQNFTAAMLPSVHFETSGVFVYAMCEGQSIQKFNYLSGSFIAANSIFKIPDPSPSGTVTNAGGPTGYSVEYAVSYVINGEESVIQSEIGPTNVPIAAGQSNIVDALVIAGSNTNGLSELRVYRRPASAGAYGYIGSSSFFYLSGGNVRSTFVDLGQDADYTHTFPFPITPIISASSNPLQMLSNTGVIYQQSLLLTDSVLDREAIYRSRPGYQGNFLRNFPLDAASALKFKAGTSGYARVLRMLDSDGLVVFTTAGIFLNQGTLEPDNIALTKKGRWIINQFVPPLAVPGGVLFVDNATNSVRNLLWNLQIESFQAEEVSIYSEHLFRTRQIKYWNFQEGIFPLLWVVFSDGTFASFTFEFDQQMKAWTRHDSAPAIKVESSCATINPDTTFFVVTKVLANGTVRRYTEYTISRFVPPANIALDSEWYMNPSIAYMDSVKSFATVINDQLRVGETIQIVTTTPEEDWSLPLTITCGTSRIFGAINAGLVELSSSIIGYVFRYFDSDGCAFDLTVTALLDDNTVTVQPNIEFPSAAANNPKLYEALVAFVGLTHLEGEYPAVIVDGAVVCSPNNDVDNYPAAQVVNGVLILPNDLRGAIVHVGRPIIGDVETLDIDTVEQQPTLIESMTVNKVYVKTHNSSGLFVGNKYPKDGNVVGMSSLDGYDVDYTDETPIIGNRAQPPKSKRYEITLPGDWKSQGKICLRQVDPLHFEILSIIPDCEILKRSDR